MKTNADHKYDKIFNELKEEKMNWDFEDFLAKAEEKEEIIPHPQLHILFHLADDLNRFICLFSVTFL